jgi:TPR repeat protein
MKRRGEARQKGYGKGAQGWHGAIIAIALGLASPAFGNALETGRDLMEEGRFAEAMEAFKGPARSGNADAEELIGVMYAMGLGVERDDRRAFEWYMRSAMKGHPGAQSGIGWYYEVGRGLPAPDLVRAYMWYALSAIGGDPDAAISLEEVVKKMTADQIAAAQVLIDDYKGWMYPFR